MSSSALSRAERNKGGYRWLARKARRATGNLRAPETGEEGWRPEAGGHVKSGGGLEGGL